MPDNYFERWKLDPRYFYVWFDRFSNAFGTDQSGPHIAVCDDFGNLVHVVTL